MKTFNSYLLEYPELTESSARILLDFYRTYQTHILIYLANQKNIFDRLYPKIKFSGFFSGIDIGTGNLKPLEQQYAVTKIDCRMLYILSLLFVKQAIPDEQIIIDSNESLGLCKFFAEYLDFIYEKLEERFQINNNSFPAFADIRTNKELLVPNQSEYKEYETEPGYNLIYGHKDFSKEKYKQFWTLYTENLRFIIAGGGYIAYGLLKNKSEIVNKGIGFINRAKKFFVFDFREFFSFFENNTELVYPKTALSALLRTSVGSMKVLSYVERQYKDADKLKDSLLRIGWETLEFIFENYCDYHTGESWEYNGLSGKPFVSSQGDIVCDTVSTAELCYVCADLCNFLPGRRDSSYNLYKWQKKEILTFDLQIMAFLTRSAYLEQGIMANFTDIVGYNPLCDFRISDNRTAFSASYRNVRDLSAAALTVYYFTGRPECLIAYQIAQNATYRHYPFSKIENLLAPFLYVENSILRFPDKAGNPDWSYDIEARDSEIEIIKVLLEHS